jgi:mRNA interferase RelE/StbE
VTYSIKIKASAQRDIASLPRPERARVIAGIDALAAQPALGSRLKGQFQGLWRLRVGRYRIIYEVLDGELIVLVLRVGHRRDVYR